MSILLNGTVHKLPKDLSVVIFSLPKVKNLWQEITPLSRNEWICWITSAKKIETRNRRIKIMIDKMKRGERRPCCWAGCPHR